MMQMTFSPKLRATNDVLADWLLAIAQYVLLGTMAVMPVLFLPQAQVSLGLSKVFFVLLGGVVSLIVFSLFVLRIGMLRVVAPWVLVPLWGVGLLAVASALLSGDRMDALVGDTLQIQTAAFFLLIALVASVTALILDSKSIIVRFFIGLSVVAFILELWHLLRFVFPQWLSFGVFTSPTVSPLGSFNDVALFAGLIIILSIVALIQLPLRGYALGFVSTIVVMSLMLLAVINFFTVWLVVGFFTLLVFLYSLTRDRLLSRPDGGAGSPMMLVSRPILAVLALVCVVSAVFIVAGSYVGTALSNTLGIQYLEVRPSFSATVDILRATYDHNGAFLGIGPNRFDDAWRLYKDPVINETLFWNTTFTAGSGYIPTLFVTLGLAGGLVFLMFLGSFLYGGYRMLITPSTNDPFWYFVATAAFASAVYLWGMAVVYVPGAALLLFAAFWTGLSLVALVQLSPQGLKVVSFTESRPRAFVLIAAVMIAITIGVGALFMASKQFAAHVVYARAVTAAAANPDPVAADAALTRALNLFTSDQLVAERVRLRLNVLATLLNTTTPTEEDKQRFPVVADEALRLAGQAVALDSTNPANHALLGSIYGALALVGIENTREQAIGSLARARELDPQNPEYALIEAQLMTRLNDFERARGLLMESLSVKRNYVDALFLLSQLDVTEGKTEAAIATVRSIITIEPQNPTRYFQLGVLLLAQQDRAGAMGAFETAIQLDPNFANARYILALSLIEENRLDEALNHLRTVAATNSDNETLMALIRTLESGQPVNAPLGGITPPVAEQNQVQVDGEGVTTSTTPPETDLLSPVNQGGKKEEASTAASSEMQTNGAPAATSTP